MDNRTKYGQIGLSLRIYRANERNASKTTNAIDQLGSFSLLHIHYLSIA
jgi:hypothetical protein